MNRKNRNTTRLLTAALLLASTPLAFAAGTDANTLIQNVAQVNYTINGNAQTQQQNDATSAQFRVDRLVTFTVTPDAATVNANPNQTGAALSFTVTNNSNDVLDFSLASQQNTSDDFDAANVQVFVETDGVPGYSAGDTMTYIDELAEGDSRIVYIVGDIPIAAANGEQDAFYLVATAALGGTASTQGADLVAAATNDAMTVENVFGEGTSGGGTGDGNNDGKNSATSLFNVEATTIAVNKTFVVLNDPINGTTDPHPIPGAEILYCISVSNSGGQTASDVVISDQVPAGTTFLASGDGGVIKTFAGTVTCGATLITTGGTVVPDATGYNAGTNTVTTNNGSVAPAGATSTIFQVTITP